MTVAKIYGASEALRLQERKLILPRGYKNRAPMAHLFGMNVFVDDTLPDNTMEIESGGRRHRFAIITDAE
jgi:hypothetical protein